MTTPLDLAPLWTVLAHLDTDLVDADAALTAAATADWVSLSAELFRDQLSDAQRRIAAIDVTVTSVRAALLRAL